jgi:hypothetical protein
MAETQYLRNEKGEVSMMPLIHWHVDHFDAGLFVQLAFAATPEEFAAGNLDVVQLALSPEQAQALAALLTKHGDAVLASQRVRPAKQ